MSGPVRDTVTASELKSQGLRNGSAASSVGGWVVGCQRQTAAVREAGGEQALRAAVPHALLLPPLVPTTATTSNDPDTSTAPLRPPKRPDKRQITLQITGTRSGSQRPPSSMADDAKIQQYLLLAKSARGRALCELINKATAEPGLFAFGELLDTPAVNEVGLWAARFRSRAAAGRQPRWGGGRRPRRACPEAPLAAPRRQQAPAA